MFEDQFEEEIKLMREDQDTFNLRRWGKKCSYCPQNRCVLCVEGRKYLRELLEERTKNWSKDSTER